MKTMKRKWGKPVTEVQQFVPQYCTGPCSLVPGSVLFYALAQECNGQEGRQANEDHTETHTWYLLDPQPNVSNWVPEDGDCFKWEVNSYKVFHSEDDHTNFEELSVDPWVTWAEWYFPRLNITPEFKNIFYRKNSFTARPITDETKNISG